MESKFKGTIIKAKRGSFVNPKSGELIGYCHFYALVLGPTNEDESGYDCKKLKCKPEYYARILEFIKANKSVDITIELVEQPDGNYRSRVIAIDDMKII